MPKIWKNVSIFVLLAALAGTTAHAQAQGGKIADLRITEEDYALGSPGAPIVIVEYASLTCPACKRFHTDVLPGLKKEFVDTGRVRLIYRDFPLDQLAYFAAKTARCAGREKYFGFLDVFYQTQSQWATSSNPLQALQKLARLGGMSEKAFNDCLQDKETETHILGLRLEAAQDFGVNSTPTIFINGERYHGLSLEELRTILQRLS